MFLKIVLHVGKAKVYADQASLVSNSWRNWDAAGYGINVIDALQAYPLNGGAQ